MRKQFEVFMSLLADIKMNAKLGMHKILCNISFSVKQISPIPKPFIHLVVTYRHHDKPVRFVSCNRIDDIICGYSI